MRRRRARGFTLIEILIALALSGIMSAFLLMLTRSQLMAYQVNEGISRTQDNARAGMDYLALMLRRACGGIGNGQVGINVSGVTPSIQPCLKIWDGAQLSGGSFSSASPTTLPDAIEVIYGTAPYTQITTVPDFTKGITVADTTGFKVGDFVLVTNFAGNGELYKIAGIAGTVGGTLTFDSATAPIPIPANGAVLAYTAPGINDGVLKAQSLSVYRSTANNYTNGMLMLDPDGMAGKDHTDAQPLVEAVADLQVAVGIDADNNGIIANTEWQGATSALRADGTIATLPWNSGTTQPLLRQIRVTLVAQTTSQYSGKGPVPGPFEDASAASYLTTTAGTTTFPRYRALSMTVAPRAWNPLN